MGHWWRAYVSVKLLEKAIVAGGQQLLHVMVGHDGDGEMILRHEPCRILKTMLRILVFILREMKSHYDITSRRMDIVSSAF